MSRNVGKPRNKFSRNAQCPCGSALKFKYCHGRNAQSSAPVERRQYIDKGEVPIRWVISSDTGTAFFASIDNQIIVFANRADAVSCTYSAIFDDEARTEMHIAGIGPAKLAHLTSTLPFVQVEDYASAMILIDARLAHKTAELQ